MFVCHLGLFFILLQAGRSFGEETEQCQPGFSTDTYVFKVTRKILERGRVLGKVRFDDCTEKKLRPYNVEESRFRITPDGTVSLKRQLELHNGVKTFTVHTWDSAGRKYSAEVVIRNEREHPSPESKTMSASSDSPLTTHVLNTASGTPAKGLRMQLSLLDNPTQRWVELTTSFTNSDGRCPGILSPERFTAGTYKLRFDTGEFWKQLEQISFYPYVEVVFTILDPGQKYHIPLLMSPFSYTTYRGS